MLLWRFEIESSGYPPSGGSHPAIQSSPVYLRWAYFSSRVSARSHNASVQNLSEFLEGGREVQPHWGEFLERWGASTQPCPRFVIEPTDEPGPQPTESHLRSEDVMS